MQPGLTGRYRYRPYRGWFGFGQEQLVLQVEEVVPFELQQYGHTTLATQLIWRDARAEDLKQLEPFSVLS